MNCDYKKNTYRNLYYVYTYNSQDREVAKKELFKVREKYKDLNESWLYAGNFKGPHIPGDDWDAMMSPSLRQEKPEVKEKISNENLVADKTELPVEKEESKISEEQVKDIAKREPTPVKVPAVKAQVGESLIYINAYNAGNLKEVIGNFKIFDGERDKELRDITSHELTVIKNPRNATNRIKIKSDIFGYREAEHVLDIDEPLSEGKGIVELLGDTIVLNFDMLRFNKGDIMTLWQVYFYKDAAIMREESVGELNQLLAMMKENNKIKIMIHGHTNGNSHGTVLHLDLDDKNFFSLTGSHNENTASAKKLSEYRAYTIQHWLMDQGISEDRMEIRGWGGKKMIYDKHDPKAHKNVRVEIEIVEE
jgi:outer membrane protein OmpA-like peptidoglycan-associated protein